MKITTALGGVALALTLTACSAVEAEPMPVSSPCSVVEDVEGLPGVLVAIPYDHALPSRQLTAAEVATVRVGDHVGECHAARD